MSIQNIIDTFIEIITLDLIRYIWGTLSISFLLILLSKQLIKRKIQKNYPTKHQRKFEILHSFNSTIVFSVLGTAFIFVYGTPASVIASEQSISVYAFILQVIALAITHDTYFYWTHRAIHHKKIYKYTHTVHHKSRTPTPFTSYSFSLPEAFIQALFFTIALQFVPMHVEALIVYLNILMVRNAVGHSGFELYPNWWLNSPLKFITPVTHHDIHHDRFKYNFGLHFNWWDKICKTEAPYYEARFYEATNQYTIQTAASNITSKL
ncbi:sterol desaturase family protein [Marinicellulosiphila megalodicopiae]|uniref:sterol desaturase family protein n=1 Tax=Marinicellulosiphila megalodicopiae TaxID=2724896 RepID=UPI003BAF230D